MSKTTDYVIKQRNKDVASKIDTLIEKMRKHASTAGKIKSTTAKIWFSE